MRAILRATDEIVIFSVIPFPSNTWWQVIVANSFNRDRSTVFINSELIQHRSRIGPDFARLFPERDRGRRAEECRKICFGGGGEGLARSLADVFNASSTTRGDNRRSGS